MAGRKKYTARGTLRLTKKQRSRRMKRFWQERRATGSAPPEKPKKQLDEARSKRMKASWRRRRRAGAVPLKQKRVLLTHEQRSEVSRAAAALRLARSKEHLRAERERLGLRFNATWSEIRTALREEQARKAARKRRKSRERRAAQITL